MYSKIGFITDKKDVSKIEDKNIELFAFEHEAILNPKLNIKSNNYFENYFQESSHFKLNLKANKIAQNWRDNKPNLNLEVMGISLNKYSRDIIFDFSQKVLRSNHIIEKIIKNIKPKEIFVSPKYLENPNRRWQTQLFSVENIIAINFAKQNNIKLINLYPDSIERIKFYYIIYKAYVFKILGTLKQIIIYKSLKQFQQITISDQKDNILMLAHHYQIFNLLDLIQKLQKDHRLNLKLISKSTNEYQSKLKKNKIKYYDYNNFVTRKELLISIYYQLLFGLKWLTLLPKINKILRSLEIPDQLHSIYKDKFIYLFLIEFSQFASEIYRTKRIIKLFSPNVVVAEMSGPPNQAFLMLSRKYQYKTLLLQHGVAGATRYPGNSYQDYFAIWGKLCKETYDPENKHNDEIFLTGYPILSKIKSISTKKLPLRLARKVKNKLVFTLLAVCNNPTGLKSQIRIINSLFDSVNKLSFKPIIFLRFHPSDNYQSIIDLAKNLKINFVMVNNLELKSILRISDLVFTQNTTAGIVATILNCKLIYLNLYTYPRNLLPFATSKSAIGAYSKLRLDHAIDSLLKETIKDKKIRIKNQNQFAIDYCGPLDGKASERIIQAIKSILKEAGKPILKSV